jgi:DNA-binding MarR family transcriptional regulator
MQQSAKPSKLEAVHGAIEQLRVLATVFERRREALAREVGLTVEQWRVLEEVATEHFMPSMFARSRESSQAAVSKILRQLLDVGIILSAISNGDRRQRVYALTAKGHRVLGELRANRQRAIDAIWATLPAGELAAFRNFARKLTARIEAWAERERMRGVGREVRRRLVLGALPSTDEARNARRIARRDSSLRGLRSE